MKVYFDMDGTFVNLYGVENWLEDLRNFNERPYREAKPLFRMCDFARVIHKLQNKGIEVGVITWLAKNSTHEYDRKVIDAKTEWLKKHLPTVEFDELIMVEHGTPKELFGEETDVLFDDEKQNRDNWKGIAHNVENIIEDLKKLLDNLD